MNQDPSFKLRSRIAFFYAQFFIKALYFIFCETATFIEGTFFYSQFLTFSFVNNGFQVAAVPESAFFDFLYGFWNCNFFNRNYFRFCNIIDFSLADSFFVECKHSDFFNSIGNSCFRSVIENSHEGSFVFLIHKPSINYVVGKICFKKIQGGQNSIIIFRVHY